MFLLEADFMKSCLVLSLNIVLCWRHLSILLGCSVLKSRYSQKDSKVIGKALHSVRVLQDPALFPLLIPCSFALAANRSQATLSNCSPCLPSDGSVSSTGSWMGDPGPPPCFFKSCRVLSAHQPYRSSCRSALQFTPLTWVITKSSRLVPCCELPLSPVLAGSN